MSSRRSPEPSGVASTPLQLGDHLRSRIIFIGSFEPESLARRLPVTHAVTIVQDRATEERDHKRWLAGRTFVKVRELRCLDHGLIRIFERQMNEKYAEMIQCRRTAFGASLLFQSSAVLVLALMAATQMGCSRADGQPRGPSLELRSNSFEGDAIPTRYSNCKGQDDISPELSWKAGPDHTQSFALIVFDKNSPLGFKFTHWVLYDIPPDKRDLPENTPKQEQLPDGSRQGNNDYDRIGYVGPCPPGHSPHHYVFDLYALDTKQSLPPGSSKKQVLKAMKEHVLASGELIGSYQH